MTARYREWQLECKVYVGNLGNHATKHDVESTFSKFGKLRNVWVARNPSGFAFVEFNDPRDAEDAVQAMDGMKLLGNRIRCEMSHGRSRRSTGRGGGGGGGRRPPLSSRGRYNYDNRRYRSRSRSPLPRRRYSRSRSRSPRDRSPRMPRSISRSISPRERR